MKELDNYDKLSAKQAIEIMVQDKKKIEHRLESSCKPLKGHTMFQIVEQTLEVSPAEFEKYDLPLNLENFQRPLIPIPAKRVIIKKGCVYISALRKESALKRYLSGKGSASIPEAKMVL